MVRGPCINHPDQLCEGCVLGKQFRNSFPKEGVNVIKSMFIFMIFRWTRLNVLFEIDLIQFHLYWLSCLFKRLQAIQPEQQKVLAQIVEWLKTFLGETKRKFESVYRGGTMSTPDSGQVFQYWHCCGSEDPFDPGCTAAPHASYND
ncbi:hypothetical protein ACOSP7_026247 [Xanthoceras sorbifolium]